MPRGIPAPRAPSITRIRRVALPVRTPERPRDHNNGSAIAGNDPGQLPAPPRQTEDRTSAKRSGIRESRSLSRHRSMEPSASPGAPTATTRPSNGFPLHKSDDASRSSAKCGRPMTTERRRGPPPSPTRAARSSSTGATPADCRANLPRFRATADTANRPLGAPALESADDRASDPRTAAVAAVVVPPHNTQLAPMPHAPPTRLAPPPAAPGLDGTDAANQCDNPCDAGPRRQGNASRAQWNSAPAQRTLRWQ